PTLSRYTAKAKCAPQPVTQRFREIAHLRKRAHALLVDPIHDLLSPVRALVVGGEKSRHLVEEKRVDGAFDGRLHAGGYVTRLTSSKRQEDLTRRSQRSELTPSFLCVRCGLC